MRGMEIVREMRRNQPAIYGQSERSRVAAFLLCLFFPGLHRFYVGRWFSGLLFIFTFGGFGIWYLADLLVILLGTFTDRCGKEVQKL